MSPAQRAAELREQIRYYDWIEKPTPHFVLHFGERMTSKKILEWVKKIGPEYHDPIEEPSATWSVDKDSAANVRSLQRNVYSMMLMP